MENDITNQETFTQKLCKILVKQGTFTQENADDFARLFRESPKANFDDFLLEDGLIIREDLLKALAELYQTPSFDVLGHFFNHQLVRIFPKGELIRKAIIPLYLEEDILTLVAGQPDNPELNDFIMDYVDFGLEFYVGIRQDIINAINEFYDEAVTEIPQDLIQTEEEELDVQKIAMGDLMDEEE